MKSETLVKRDGVKVCIQTHGPDPGGLEVREGAFHQLLPDALAPQFRRDNDRFQEREAVVGRRRQDPDHASVALRGEASGGREREESPEVLARVAPRLEVRQGDGRVDVPLFESSDPRAFHNLTRRSSSSGSSHSCYPYVTYRLSFRRCLYFHGPRSPS